MASWQWLNIATLTCTFALLFAPGSAVLGVISAISGGISAGSSLAGTTANALLGGTGYNVAAAIEVENYTKWPLIRPKTIIHGGLISKPSQRVNPGIKEVMMMHKTGHTATGTYGTVSWEVANNVFVIMWSVPYSHDFHSNWLAVGGCENCRSSWHTYNTFSQMHDGNPYWSVRREYYYSTSTIHWSCSDFEVTATMGTSHKTKIEVNVIPHNNADLAERLKVLLTPEQLNSN